MDGSQRFEPREFLDRLKRDDIQPPIVMVGMVKPADDSDDYLLFAPGQVCENWTRIPLSSIETISVQRLVPCADHKHPLVRLVLKQPETDEGRLFSSLMQTTSGRPRTRRSFPRGPALEALRFTQSGPPRAARAVPHGPDAGDLLPSCSGCPAWVDDHGWFGVLVGCSDTTCDYEEY